MIDLSKTEGHTPGPWYISIESKMSGSGTDIVTVYGTDTQPTEDGCGQGYVHICVDQPCFKADKAENMATAHLIALAPALKDRVLELEAALIGMLDAYGELHALYDIGDCNASIIARAALKGQSHD